MAEAQLPYVVTFAICREFEFSDDGSIIGLRDMYNGMSFDQLPAEWVISAYGRFKAGNEPHEGRIEIWTPDGTMTHQTPFYIRATTGFFDIKTFDITVVFEDVGMYDIRLYLGQDYISYPFVVRSNPNTRISTAPIRKYAKKAGIDNPYALSREAGIAYNTAKRYWNDDPSLTQFDTEVLAKISTALNCAPGDLLVRVSLVTSQHDD